MASPAAPPVRPAAPPVQTAPAASAGAAEEALVPSPQHVETEAALPASGAAMRLPVELEVAIPLGNFRVRNLLALGPGAVVESRWGQGDDVPIGSADVQLAWSEFEVMDMQMAVRLTRLV